MRGAARRAFAISVLAAGVVLWPAVAFAHPLGNFTINLYSGIQLTPGQVRIDYVVDMAEIPTFQEMPNIDTNGDGVATDAEKAAWAEQKGPELLSGLKLMIDGKPVALQVVSSSMRFRPGQGGLPILRYEGTFAGRAPLSGRLQYRDDNYGDRIGWREITALGQDGAALSGSSVPTQSVSDALLSYPQDMLSSPLHVTDAGMLFAPGISAPSGSQSSGLVATSARPGIAGGAFAGLVGKHGIPLVLLGFVLAIAFGAWHALLPGHGKTLMAAYMVGSEARVRQAVAVGSAVAVMHTSSVLALGFLVVTLEQTFRPESLYPWLGLLSGLVALGLGAGLLVVRLGAWAEARRPSNEVHSHDHGIHQHPHEHSHVRPTAPALSRKGLVALAVAGGILPSPTALVVLLAAVAFHRVVFGLALIATFSVGLAGALVVIGILALRAREAVARKLSTRWGRLMPVLSAAAIIGMGFFFTIRGIAQI